MPPRQSLVRRLLVAGAVALTAVLLLLTAQFAGGSLEDNDRVASVVSVYATLLGLAATMVGLALTLRQRESGGGAPAEADPVRVSRPLSPAALAEQADALWFAVRQFWSVEIRDRGLADPTPLRVCWRESPRPVSAPAERILGTAVGGRPARLRLRGDLSAVVDRYLALPARRLVVLGGPGAGKTGLAALLALGLLARPRAADPVPYVAPVNSWDPAREHLRTWLVRRLAEDHYGGSPEIPYQLVRGGLILPMLDGLDEVAERARPAALAAIAQAWADDAPLVVTCRGDEYAQAVAARGRPLPRAATIELAPVTAADALDYLRRSVTDQPRWQPLLAEIAREPAGPVAAALSTPLVVSLVRAVYAADATQPAELLDRVRFPDRTAIEEHVFDAVIPTAYDPAPRPGPAGTDPAAGGGSRWTRADAHRTLTVLARRLTDATRGDLAWWELHRAVPPAVVGGAYAVVAFLAAVAALSWATWEPPLLWSAVVAALLAGAAAGAGRAPAPVRAQLRLRGRAALLSRRWAAGVVGGLAAGLGLGVAVGAQFGAERLLLDFPAAAGWLADARGWRGALAGAALGSSFGVSLGGAVGVLGGLAVGVSRGLGAGCRWALRLWAAPVAIFTGTFGLVGVWDPDDLRGLVAVLTDDPDPRPVPFAPKLVRWAAEGLTTGPDALRVAEHFLLPLPLCAAVCLGVGAIFGLVSACRAAAGAAVDVTGMARPASLWRTDRRAAGAQAATVFVAVAGSAFLVVAVTERQLADPVPAALLGLGCAVGAAAFTAWFRFAVARAYLLVRYGLPWRLLDLLDDAHHRGVLRRVGATYQFRHDLLRRRLATAAGRPPGA